MPLLFDLEPSDLQESPLLQFQAASFNKEDIKKLIHTLNEAGSSQPLDTYELDEAFDVWYPKLEDELKSIPSIANEKEQTEDNISNKKSEQIMEEILDLTRINQKLLRNPDTDVSKSLVDINSKLDKLSISTDHFEYSQKKSHKFNSMLLHDFVYDIPNNIETTSRLLILLSFCKDSVPWIYDTGKHLIDILKSKTSQSKKESSMRDFMELVEYTNKMLMRVKPVNYSKENYIILNEILMHIRENMSFFFNEVQE